MSSVNIETPGLQISLHIQPEHLRVSVKVVLELITQLDYLNSYGAKGQVVYACNLNEEE